MVAWRVGVCRTRELGAVCSSRGTNSLCRRTSIIQSFVDAGSAGVSGARDQDDSRSARSWRDVKSSTRILRVITGGTPMPLPKIPDPLPHAVNTCLLAASGLRPCTECRQRRRRPRSNPCGGTHSPGEAAKFCATNLHHRGMNQRR